MLKHTGVALQVNAAARDLGVLNNPSSRRRTSLQEARLSKAKQRMKRIAPMARTLRKARSLNYTGALPQALWGTASIGMAPTQLAKLKTQLAAATGIIAAGRCPSTAIAVALGPGKDPEVTLPVQQVSLWLDLWRSDAMLRTMTARHWSQAVANVKAQDGGGVRWNKVISPLSATIATLTEQGWCLDNVRRWSDPSGAQWEPDIDAPKEPFLKLVASFASQAVWKKAANSYLGGGMEKGIDWTASLALHKHVSALERSFDTNDDGSHDAQLLELVDSTQDEVWHDNALTWLELFLTAGYWTNERASKVHPVGPYCTRCSRGQLETPMHLLWECEANKDLDDERVSSTQELIPHAQEAAELYPCLWLRGLLPNLLVTVNTPIPDEVSLWYVGSYPRGSWPAGRYHTDGSGGKYSSYAIIRRCGIGIVYMSQCDHDYADPELLCPEVLFLWGAFSALPGNCQTVPRSELMAVLTVLQRIEDGPTEVVTDCKVNVDAYAKGKTHCLDCVHADLWDAVWQILETRDIQLTLRWCKGHAEEPEVMVRYQVPAWDVFGNLCADAMANRGAEKAEVSGQDGLTVLWHYSLVRRIQSRAIVVLTSVLEGRSAAARRAKRPREVKPTKVAQIMQSKHQITVNGCTLHCHRCHKSSPHEPKARAQWLASECVPNYSLIRSIKIGDTKPMEVPKNQVVEIGRSVVHHSHALAIYRGIYFCTLCGYHGSAKLQMLVRECTRMATPAARSRVRALRRGTLPSNLACWPADSQRNECLDVYSDYK